MTCLEKAPEQRYPSARALADDLDRFLNGEPVQARRTGVLGRVRLKARKNPRTAMAAAAAILTMVVLAGLGINERRSAAHRAELARNLGREVERMVGMLEHDYLLPLHDIRPVQQRVRERMASIDSRIEGLDPVSMALSHYAIGRGHLRWANPPRHINVSTAPGSSATARPNSTSPSVSVWPSSTARRSKTLRASATTGVGKRG